LRIKNIFACLMFENEYLHVLFALFNQRQKQLFCPCAQGRGSY